MKTLVKIKENTLVVDSRDLEYVFNIQHRSILRLIKKHESRLAVFGKVRFEITPTTKGQNQSMAYLNESQTMLLLTYTRSNVETDKYRLKLISDFLKMRSYIRQQETLRLAGVEIRKTLTEKLQESGENERMHGHGYSTYTKLVYALTGLTGTFKEWKIDHPDKKISFRDYLIPEDLKKIELAESIIKPLVEMGKQYSEIKETLEPLFKSKALNE